MKRHKLTFLICAAMAAAVSCSMERTQPPRNLEREGGGTIPVHFRILPSNRTESSYGYGDETVREFFLAACCNGNMTTFFLADDLGGQDILLDLEASQKYTFYAIANYPGINPEDFRTEDDIKRIRLDVDPDGGGFPLCATFSTTAGTETVPISLSHLVSRWSFAVDRSNLPTLYIKSACIRNCATRLYPFCAEDMEENYDCVPSQGGDFLTDADIEAVNDGYAAVFYVPENRQGTLLDGTDGSYGKTERNIMEAGHDPGRCTYIEISAGFDDSSRSPFSGEIVYRFYLGEDASANFDIVRNTSRSITFSPTFESATSTEIQWLVKNDGVIRNSYGELKVYSVDRDGNIIREMGGDVKGRLRENSRGGFQVYFIDENLGIRENVTSSTTWSIDGTLHRSDEEDLSAANIIKAMTDVTKEEEILLQYEREDQFGRMTAYDAAFSVLDLKNFGRDPYTPATTGSQVMQCLTCSADGTLQKDFGTATDPNFNIPCTVFDSDYSCLKIILEYDPEYWESIDLEITGCQQYSLKENLPVNEDGLTVFKKDFFYEAGRIDGNTFTPRILITDSGCPNSIVITYTGPCDEWGEREEVQETRDVQFATAVDIYATLKIKSTAARDLVFYPTAHFAWNGMIRADENFLLPKTLYCMSNLPSVITSLSKWFQYTDTTVKRGSTVIKEPYSSEYILRFSNEMPVPETESRLEATEWTMWGIPYAYPGLNLFYFGESPAYPMWVSTYNSYGTEDEIHLVRGY